MNIEQVKTFLAVVEVGSIIGASETLFVSQSSISTRLKNLEDFLGVKLLIRNKGYKEIALTPYGEKFVVIAKDFTHLYDDAKKLKHLKPYKELTIASVDAINNFTFLPLYHKFMEENKNIKLRIQTHHSNEIHGLVESRESDIGLVYSEIKYKDIISKPIYRELNYLVCHKDSPYYDGISPSELDFSKEIYLNWSQDYYQWHYHFFGDNEEKLITVNTGNMIEHYLDKSGNWSIAPISVIKSFEKTADICYYKLSSPPPPRICYQLVHRKQKLEKIETIKEFEKHMFNYIASEESICTFQEWMLEKY